MYRPQSWFNLILAIICLALAACKTTEEKKKGKEATLLRFFLEANPVFGQDNASVQVYRAHPFLITIERDPALDEGYIRDAQVVDADEQGGYAIKITFDDAGRRRLEALTVANKGRHLAINAHWTENRWLAAPLINKNISNGVFVFTPDATREESERIVAGLKNVAKKLQEKYTF